MKRWIIGVLVSFIIGTFSACQLNEENLLNQSGAFHIVSGSENITLEPIIQRWSQKNKVKVNISYKGSLEIAQILESGAVSYDAVWPANSMWITLGDSKKMVKNSESIMRSPVVLAIKKSLANQLNWVTGNPTVFVRDLLENMENGKIRLMMTSASQSNSGASAYFSFLNAFAGNPDVLQSEDLVKPELKNQIKHLLGEVNRTSESSGFLKTLFVQKYEQFDAMINYESLAIEANQSLIKEGKEPLFLIYLADGLAISDSPFGYVDHNDSKKLEQFTSLQSYLLSDPIQKEILSFGRRTGLIGINLTEADPTIFNPEWGIDIKKTLSPIKFPSAAVIREALDLYQSAFRKPSFTVFCLDFSGSMAGEGENQLKAAMKQLLLQEEAKKHLLQATPDDVTIIITFNGDIINQWMVNGNDPDNMLSLFQKVQSSETNDGTDIYEPIIKALESIKTENTKGNNPAIILMTDGKSNENNFEWMKTEMQRINAGFVPIFCITFGDADPKELNEISGFTDGFVYDGVKDLIAAFKKAKGNN
ncbi:VWA domain-containing protein [bacterium]|nr:VWA domain-containing protein [bacterium]